MKSNSTGRSIARARSLMNMNAPLSTPTSSGARPCVVGGDLLAELGDPILRARSALTTTAPRSGSPVPASRPHGQVMRSAIGATRTWHPTRGARRTDAARRPTGHLGRARVASGDGEHPLDGRGVGRVLLASRRGRSHAAPPAEPAGRGGGRARRRRSGRRRRPARRAASASAPQQRGLTGEHGHDVALGDGVEQRQQLVAHPVAAERGIDVRRVVDRLEPVGGAQRRGLRPAQARAADGAVAGMPARPSRPAPRRG